MMRSRKVKDKICPISIKYAMHCFEQNSPVIRYSIGDIFDTGGYILCLGKL